MADTSPHFPDSFHRVSVKALITDGEQRVLLQHTPMPKGWWDMPGGGVDFGETPQEALHRELIEEMGIETSYVAPHPTYVWTAKTSKRGKLDWFYTLTVCYQAKVENLEATITDECDEIRFFSKQELPGLKFWCANESFKTIFDPNDLL